MTDLRRTKDDSPSRDWVRRDFVTDFRLTLSPEFEELTVLVKAPSDGTRSTGTACAIVPLTSNDLRDSEAVSYTHLTLPTKRIV